MKFDREDIVRRARTRQRDQGPWVYQYATGRGGVPLRGESSLGMEEFEENREMRQGPHFGKGPKGWKRSDERIKEDVCEALYRSYDVDATHIDVAVNQGVVTLSGTVDSRDTKRLAEDVAEGVGGVHDVQNRLSFRKDEPHIKHSDSTPEDEKGTRLS
jgi:hypothetical protein